MEKDHHHRHHKHRHHHRSRSREKQSIHNNLDKGTSLLSKHQILMEEYRKMKRQLKPVTTGKTVTDNDAIARNTQFIMDTDIEKATNWEQRLAIRYYNRLFKEYALVDLSYYQINKIGMRWRTEKEVIEGKGQFACGNIHCDNSNIHDLCSYEVPFSYRNLSGEKVTTLVKVRVCGPCAIKLHYKKIKEYEHLHPEARKRRKECSSSQDVFSYLADVVGNNENEVISDTVETEQPKPIEVTKQEVFIEKEKPTPKPKVVKNKPKRKDGHSHYSSSSSEEESVCDDESSEEESKTVDANGNEVISTSDDIWKTHVEVEHTENENMDDFINQLFM